MEHLRKWQKGRRRVRATPFRSILRKNRSAPKLTQLQLPPSLGDARAEAAPALNMLDLPGEVF
jgi:hypothetical protein